MKVYDTDEDAIASGARKRMLARVVTTLMMLAFSGLSLWLVYTFFFAPEAGAQELAASLPVARVSTVLFVREAVDTVAML